MIVVYAEQIVFDNLCVDSVLMFATCKILSIRSSKWRIFAAGALGSAAALLSGYFGGWVAWAAKFATAPIMVALASKRLTPKKYFCALGLMLCLTFMYGGACYILLDFIGIAAMQRIPIGLVTLCACLIGVLTVGFLRRMKRFTRQSRHVYRCAVTYKGIRIEVRGYLDSGNTLSYQGLPVVVMDYSLWNKLLGETLTACIRSGQIPAQLKGAWITCSTVKGTGKLFVIQPDKFEIYSDKRRNILIEVMIGIDRVKEIADCKTLLNFEMEACT